MSDSLMEGNLLLLLYVRVSFISQPAAACLLMKIKGEVTA
jgi:hypothetical protein